MIKFSSNLYFKDEDESFVRVGTNIQYFDFNLGVKYVKGDEDFINVRFKIKPLDCNDYFYLTISNIFATKKEFYLNSSGNILVRIDEIPQYEELIIEIEFSRKDEDKVKNKGDLELILFTRKF